MRFVVIVMLAACSFMTQAYEIGTYEFDTIEKETLYGKMIKELRCMVCQNNNLADSNAELAQDLRRQTYELVEQGMNEEEVVDYMVNRYGDFVLYRPQMKPTTILLWVGPFLILLIGVVALLRMIRRRSNDNDELLSETDQKAAESMLAEDREKK